MEEKGGVDHHRHHHYRHRVEEGGLFQPVLDLSLPPIKKNYNGKDNLLIQEIGIGIDMKGESGHRPLRNKK